MRNGFAVWAAMAASFALTLPVAHASDESVASVASQINAVVALQGALAPADLINWKVGDSMDYTVKMLFGNGSSHKEVTKDEGTALWFNQVISILGQNQKVEALIQKADGKILKYIVNGQEQAAPDDKLEIISSEYTSVTVPAGKFDAFHVIAKSQQVSKLETWINPAVTCMDGSLKTIIQSQFGAITMELTKFNRMP